VYGTLISEKVLLAIIGRVPKQAKATVTGYKRYALKNRSYPMMVRTGDDQDLVQGKVIMDISPRECTILDHYETKEYQRVIASAELEGGEKHEVFTYIAALNMESEFNGEWNYEQFERKYLSVFLATDCGVADNNS